MEIEQTYYSNILKTELSNRQKLNRLYSLRAFSRDLQMHSATLTLVLQNKRPLPLKNLDNVIKGLKLSPKEEFFFRESALKKRKPNTYLESSQKYYNRYFLDETFHIIISEWEYYGVLTLMETGNFVSNTNFIAQRLNCTKARIEVVIDKLISSKLVKQDVEGNLHLTQGPLRTTEDIKSKALVKSHKETLDMGKSKIDEIEVELRDFSSMMIAVDPKKIQESKTIIREFRQRMASLLRDGERTEVYQLAIQLYPITNLNIQKGE